jgi:hypothetical protein
VFAAEPATGLNRVIPDCSTWCTAPERKLLMSDVSESWQDHVRALPYRSTFKLARAKDEPSFRSEGWTVALFRDERGNLFQRERDGKWERWSLVLDRRDEKKGLTLHKADLQSLNLRSYGLGSRHLTT